MITQYIKNNSKKLSIYYFSATQQVEQNSKEAKEIKYQELCYKFERDWQRIKKETESNQLQFIDNELTPAQKKRIDFLTEALLDLNYMEQRYLQFVLRDKILKTTSVSPLKLNIDWPSMKKLEDGSWPPANPNWFLQQEAVAKLWPSGQSGLAQLFGGISGGSGGGAAAAPAQGQAAGGQAAEQKQEAKQPEPPKEKQNYDMELAAIDAAQKIKIIKEVRAILNLGLKEAKELVEKTPVVIKKELKKAEAEELKEKLTAIGCTINLL